MMNRHTVTGLVNHPTAARRDSRQSTGPAAHGAFEGSPEKYSACRFFHVWVNWTAWRQRRRPVTSRGSSSGSSASRCPVIRRSALSPCCMVTVLLGNPPLKHTLCCSQLPLPPLFLSSIFGSQVQRCCGATLPVKKNYLFQFLPTPKTWHSFKPLVIDVKVALLK